MARVLLSLSLLLSAILLSESITSFPVYFFCDEAIHGVEAWSILKTGRDTRGIWLPLYPQGLGQWQLSFSVYAQIPFLMFFGLSEFAVRFRNIFFAVLALAAVLDLLRLWGWSRGRGLVPLLFLIAPFWFLHARTGFEAPLAGYCLFGFLWAYARWLKGERIFGFVAPIFLMLAFYSYLPARGWVALGGVFIALCNARTHLRLWRSSLWAALVVLVLLAPLVFFSIRAPRAAAARLQDIGLDNFLALDRHEQLAKVVTNYASSLDPRFWFTWEHTPQEGPQTRHVIPELPLIPWWLLPAWGIGMFALLRRVKDPAVRAFWALLLACPLPTSPFAVTNLRILWVGFSYILLAGCGVAELWGWFAARTSRKLQYAFASAACAALGVYIFAFRQYVQAEASLRYRDHGFYGTQAGAPEVFAWIRAHFERHDQFILGHSSFNQNEIFFRFYFSPEERAKLQVRDAKSICDNILTKVGAGEVWVLRTEWFAEAAKESCPYLFTELDEIRSPKGDILFKIGFMRRGENFNTWLEERERARKELVPGVVLWRGDTLQIRHTKFDIGSLGQLFDGEEETLGRSALVNPMELVIEKLPRPVHALRIVYSHTPALAVRVFCVRDKGQDEIGAATSTRVKDATAFEIPLSQDASSCDALRLTIRSSQGDDRDPVHVREVVLE